MTRYGIYLLLSGSLALSALPQGAFADEKTGIAAGLGVAAASGKTTMGDGAGAIEAALLDSDSILQAGAIIRTIADKAELKLPAPKKAMTLAMSARQILVLGSGDKVDYTMARWIGYRMSKLTSDGGTLFSHCKKPAVAPAAEPKKPAASLLGESIDLQSPTTAPKFGFARSDAFAALANEVTVGKIDLADDDVPLVQAIVMAGTRDRRWHGPADLARLEPNSSSPENRQAKAEPDTVDGQADRHWMPDVEKNYLIPRNKRALDPEHNHAFTDLAALQDQIQKSRACVDDANKAWVASADQFVTSIIASDKGEPPILAWARLPKVTAQAVEMPLVLDVTMEAHGGTSITRSNVWYSLGIPGAAVITSGLKASFILSDPESGETLVAGIVRCVTKPKAYNTVRRELDRTYAEDDRNRLTACDYRLGYVLNT